MCLWAAECISQQANLPGSMPCFFKQSLEGRTCSASVQTCPDSCLIVFVCVCWNLIGWVARFAVLFTQVVNDYMRLASKSLIPYWVHPYAEGDTANVLCFSSLTHTIYETELGCPGMKERAFQKKKPSLESDILAVSRRLWDAAIWCYLMLFACSNALSSPTVSQQFSKIKEASLIYRKFSGLFLLLKCRFWKGRQIHRPWQLWEGKSARAIVQAMLSLYMCIANGVSWEQVIIPLNAASGPFKGAERKGAEVCWSCTL